MKPPESTSEGAQNDCDLIAAAPEMLALLTRAFMALKDTQDWGSTGLVQEMRALIQRIEVTP